MSRKFYLLNQLGLALFCAALSTISAEVACADSGQSLQTPRFMLGDSAIADKTADLGFTAPLEIAPESSNETPKAADFAWSALAKNSLASGTEPVIGAGSGKPYFDFHDGLPHPFYIAPSTGR